MSVPDRQVDASSQSLHPQEFLYLLQAGSRLANPARLLCGKRSRYLVMAGLPAGATSGRGLPMDVFVSRGLLVPAPPRLGSPRGPTAAEILAGRSRHGD